MLGFVSAATAVAATTNGSIAEKTSEEDSDFPPPKKLSEFNPKESRDTFPSLRCHPTLPRQGNDVEHAETHPLRPPPDALREPGALTAAI